MYVGRTYTSAVKFIELFFDDLQDCRSYDLTNLLYIAPVVYNNGSSEYLHIISMHSALYLLCSKSVT